MRSPKSPNRLQEITLKNPLRFSKAFQEKSPKEIRKQTPGGISEETLEKNSDGIVECYRTSSKTHYWFSTKIHSAFDFECPLIFFSVTSSSPLWKSLKHSLQKTIPLLWQYSFLSKFILHFFHNLYLHCFSIPIEILLEWSLWTPQHSLFFLPGILTESLINLINYYRIL